jgi:hypothetical protein
MQLESKLTWIQFKNWIKIQLKKNEMQIIGEVIENLFLNMVSKNNNNKEIDLKRHISMPLYLGIC